MNEKKIVREGREKEASEEEDTDPGKDFLMLIIMREPCQMKRCEEGKCGLLICYQQLKSLGMNLYC